MISEWKEIWMIVSTMIMRQQPPVQIFICLGLAFTLLMFVEGLRASFLPRRSHDVARPRIASRPHEPPKALPPGGSGETSASWTPHLNAARNPKRVADPPRHHQAFKPKIRRISSLEVVAPEVREQTSDFGGQQTEQSMES